MITVKDLDDEVFHNKEHKERFIYMWQQFEKLNKIVATGKFFLREKNKAFYNESIRFHLSITPSCEDRYPNMPTIYYKTKGSNCKIIIAGWTFHITSGLVIMPPLKRIDNIIKKDYIVFKVAEYSVNEAIVEIENSGEKK